MKKLFVVLFVSFILVSCWNNGVAYKVTVVSKTQKSALKKFVGGPEFFNAVTESGDTVQCTVDDQVRLKNKMPYKAMMRIESGTDQGHVFKLDPDVKK